MLYWTDDSEVRTLLEPRDDDPASRFTYDLQVSEIFATMAYVQKTASMGDFVALVCRITSVTQRWTRETEEPYVQVQGLDMAGERVGPLFLWLFDDEQVYEGMYCIVRGLKVAEEKQWDYMLGSRQPTGSGIKVLECKDRTAVEDVTDVEDIKGCFNG